MTTLKNLTTLALAASVVTACAKSSKTAITPPPDTTTDTTTHNPPPPPQGQVLVAAGNIAKCTNANSELTARIIDTMATATVVALGNNANPLGTMANYENCYQPTWGRFLNRTYAALGPHDYDSTGSAMGAFQYFGTKVGPVNKGYYSFDLGTWHIIVLNSQNKYVPYTSASEQTAWLQQDLQATKAKCIMAIWHDPRFESSSTGNFERTTLANTWSRLYAANVSVILNGGAYFYERMYAMAPDGSRSDSGMVQFNVGTGGESLGSPTQLYPNSAFETAVYGVIRFNLQPTSYSWSFIPVPGSPANSADAGSGNCR